MTEPTSGPNHEPTAAQFAQIEEAVRAANASRKEAEDAASYALKAKISSEEHSKTVAALKGQAEADAGWFITTKNVVEQANATIAQIRTETEAAKQAVKDATPAIDQALAAAKVSAEQVETSRTQAEKSAADAAAHHKSTIASSSAAGTSREAAAKSATESQEILERLIVIATKTQEQAATVEERSAAVAKLEETAQALVKSMSRVDTKAADTLEIIEAHEKDLQRLKSECDALHARIESLLPNATSAGLATSFREQKARFEKPQWMWLFTFVFTIVALMTSSLWGLPGGDSWDAMGRHLVNRLPIIAPLIWLAVYAGRHYGLALRLQEEYAYKEAVSAAFEGYKREMSTVSNGANGGSPLVTLCENVLNTLGQRPGRIYEGKHEDITPLTTAVNTGKDAAVAVKETVAAVAKA